MNTTPLISREEAQQCMLGNYFGITTVVGQFRFLIGTTFTEDNVMFSRGVPYPRQTLQAHTTEYCLLAVPRFSLRQIGSGQDCNEFMFVVSNRVQPKSLHVGDAHWVLLSRYPTSLMPSLEYKDTAQMLSSARADSLPTYYDLVVALAVGAFDVQDMKKRACARRNDQANVSGLFCLDTYGDSGRPHVLTIDWSSYTVHIDALQLGTRSRWYDDVGVVAKATEFAYVRLP